MANTDAPRGFVPVDCLVGGGGIPPTREYSIATTYGTNIFTGDPVEMTGTGGPNGLPNIQRAAAGNTDNIGVFMGCKYVNSSGETVYSAYWPASTASTDVTAYVVDDPFAIFEIQCITGTAFNDDMIGQLCDWSLATAGSTASGQSGAEADISSLAATGKSLRILRRVTGDPENTEAAHANIQVMFVEHAMNPHAEDGSGTIVGAGGV